MEAKKKFRVTVMKYAWQIWKATGTSWSECMVKAWQLYKLAKCMRRGVTEFIYRKVDGTLRIAHGTLANIPAGATFRGKKITKPSYKTLCYFDTDKREFRSFQIHQLIAYFVNC